MHTPGGSEGQGSPHRASTCFLPLPQVAGAGAVGAWPDRQGTLSFPDPSSLNEGEARKTREREGERKLSAHRPSAGGCWGGHAEPTLNLDVKVTCGTDCTLWATHSDWEDLESAPNVTS